MTTEILFFEEKNDHQALFSAPPRWRSAVTAGKAAF
jgi:hypothetical protein